MPHASKFTTTENPIQITTETVIEKAAQIEENQSFSNNSIATLFSESEYLPVVR